MLDENTGSILLLRGFFFLVVVVVIIMMLVGNIINFTRQLTTSWWGEGPTNIFSLSLLLMLVVDEQTKRGSISLTLQLSLVS